MKTMMPELLTGDELNEALAVFPEYTPEIRFRSAAERLAALDSICDLFVPSQMSREIYTKLYLSVQRSMKRKEDIVSVRQSYENRRAIRGQSFKSIMGGSDAWTIIGQSGIGKSAAISRGINLINRTPIYETDERLILPCLTVQTPADASLKGLFFEILRGFDEHLGTGYYTKADYSRVTTDVLLGLVSQASLSHVCLLVLDEIQNVVNARKGRVMVDTFTQLVNSAGVSICMVGTPEAAEFFGQNMMLARRSVGLTFQPMDCDDVFREFCKTLCGYLYVKKAEPFGEGLVQWLYAHSGGNLGVVVTLVHDAQELAISDGYDTFDIRSLNRAYEERLGVLRGYIERAPVKHALPKRKKEVPRKKTAIPVTKNLEKVLLTAIEEGKALIKTLRDSGITVEEVSI